jgi:hypothetical protein
MIDVDRQAISGVGIHDRQGTESLAVEQRIGHEVHCPDIIGAGKQRQLHPTRSHDMPSRPF